MLDNKSSEQYIKTGEVAKHFGLSKETIRRWCKEGKLEMIRTPGNHFLINVASVRELLNQSIIE